MDALSPETFTVDNGAIRLGLYRWGEPRGRPAVLLSHGSAFCAAVWQRVAEALSSEFVVYALDRRGHGASSKPVAGYEFADFADDMVAVVDTLQLSAAYAFGHSAGATDLLLTAARRPHAFRRIFAMEPTAMDPSLPAAAPSEHGAGRLEEALRRRATFASFEHAIEHYRARGIFQSWLPELLSAYVHHGFESLQDGSVTLRCTPAIEHALLVPIVSVMNGTYQGDARGNPFETLSQIGCPTRIATTEGSQPIFKHMAEAARRLIPNATSHHFAGVGHSVAQVQPAAVAAAALRFWAEDTSRFGA